MTSHRSNAEPEGSARRDWLTPCALCGHGCIPLADYEDEALICITCDARFESIDLRAELVALIADLYADVRAELAERRRAA